MGDANLTLQINAMNTQIAKLESEITTSRIERNNLRDTYEIYSNNIEKIKEIIDDVKKASSKVDNAKEGLEKNYSSESNTEPFDIVKSMKDECTYAIGNLNNLLSGFSKETTELVTEKIKLDEKIKNDQTNLTELKTQRDKLQSMQD